MERLIRAAEAPELAEEAARRFTEGWPEFIFHDEVSARYDERRRAAFADWEFYLVTRDGQLVGGCWGVPLTWDGTIDDLPGGFTDSLARSVGQHEPGIRPNTFVLLAGAVSSTEQGKAHSATLVKLIRTRAQNAGFTRMIAPLRPTLKPKYPLTPIDEYLSWTRPDGLPLDPWLRVHVRLGATVLASAPASQTITAPVTDWEKWTGLALPATGDYIIPGGLAPLSVDRAANQGIYTEPNIWVQHF